MDYEITNTRTGQVIAARALMASAPWTRMKGLLGKKSLPADEAIILKPASSIHTLFMRFALDIIYLDREERIVKLVPNLVPYRFSSAKGAHSTIEMASGATNGLDLQVGDQLALRPVGGA